MAWFAVGTTAMMLAVIMGTLVNGLTAFFVPMEQAEGWARWRARAISCWSGCFCGSRGRDFVHRCPPPEAGPRAVAGVGSEPAKMPGYR